MSKTTVIILAVIAVYLVVIFPKVASSSKDDKKEEKTESKADTESGTGLAENPDKNGVSRGASGQQKYRIGYTK